MLRRVVLSSLLVIASLAFPARAAEPFIALVDLDRGLLLIPDGAVVPRGVEFTMDRAGVREEGWSVESDRAPRKRFVYAYAPAERFVAARRHIEETRPRELQAFVADMDQTYYFYFDDGSYHGARKNIRNIGGDHVYYAVQTLVYAEAGAFDAKVTASQSGTNSIWSASNTCWFYGTAGTCSTPLNGVHNVSTFTGSVTSSAAIARFLYPPCDSPCKENSSSTIVINFP